MMHAVQNIHGRMMTREREDTDGHACMYVCMCVCYVYGHEQGIFAPLVRVVRSVMGVKAFNKLRGKGIQLHSQVITEFCKTIGAPPKVCV